MPPHPPTGALHAELPAETLRTALAQLAAVDDAAELHISSTKIICTATDRRGPAAVSLTLGASAFLTYHAVQSRTGIDPVSKLLDFTKLFEESDTLELSLDTTTLTLQLSGPQLSTTIALYDSADIKNPGVSVPPQPTRIELSAGGASFSHALTAARICSDDLTLTVKPERLVCTAHGDSDDMQLDIDTLHSISGPEATATYPVSNLTDMFDALPEDSPIQLNMASEDTLTIQTTFADDAGEVRYHVGHQPSNLK